MKGAEVVVHFVDERAPYRGECVTTDDTGITVRTYSQTKSYAMDYTFFPWVAVASVSWEGRR